MTIDSRLSRLLLIGALACGAAFGCGEADGRLVPGLPEPSGTGGLSGTANDGEVDPVDDPTANEGGAGGAAEPQPEPAPGGGVWEPPTSTLHDYRCAGLDWQILNHFIVIAHRAPETGDPASIKRCEERFAGWVTTAADAGKVSRASVYAALEASGACDESPTYPGLALAPSLCTKLRPDLDVAACAEKLASEPAFGIQLTADVLANATMRKAHLRDPVRMGALLGHGSVACGGDDRWKLLAPEGWLDR